MARLAVEVPSRPPLPTPAFLWLQEGSPRQLKEVCTILPPRGMAGPQWSVGEGGFLLCSSQSCPGDSRTAGSSVGKSRMGQAQPPPHRKEPTPLRGEMWVYAYVCMYLNTYMRVYGP